MADLSAVKTGDRLKVDCLVTERNLTNRIWCLRVGDDDTVLIEKAALEEAAEHIPTPRPAFKRRDLVRQISGRGYQEPYRKGIVLIPEGTRPMMPNFVNVHWPHGETSNEDPRNLEPDEAPE